jgi:2-polyprenyl-6-hydroxyphenyl methylase/3-demethylubiquinone-9 3-methyltransferase
MEALIDNEFYGELGERWYRAWDDPVALLRCENVRKLEWVRAQLRARDGREDANLLDVGCGAGLLTNELVIDGYRVTGVDLSAGSLQVARRHDPTGRVDYREADARALPFAAASFDIVTCMDFLEHVQDPAQIVAEMSRVLRPGGWLFFHTFNRNFWSWLVIVKGVEWFVRNVPRNMHVKALFIAPDEMRAYCTRAGLVCEAWTGLRPRLGRIAFWKLLATGTVPRDFEFVFTPSLRLSYLGMARRVN